MASKQSAVTIKMSELAPIPKAVATMHTELAELRALIVALTTRVNTVETENRALRAMIENRK